MATTRIVVKLGVDAALLKGRMIEVGLVRWHTEILVADEELGRRCHVLHVVHRRSLEEVDLALGGQRIEVELVSATASEDPIRDVRRVDHVGHVENGVPERRRLPHVLELRLPDHVTRKETTMAATEDSKPLRVNHITELYQSLLGQIAAILSIINTNRAQ